MTLHSQYVDERHFMSIDSQNMRLIKLIVSTKSGLKVMGIKYALS
jgi:hypothetical protein